MTISIFRKLLPALLALAPAAIQAEVISPDVRIGNLPNGLTYYISHNDNPSGTADFFLAQRVGSVNETENQRGLAHFLEHMCFNGTEHFPGNSLITYLESIGVKFGAHLNAYTSTDETVYNISKAPTSRDSAVDSCLLILRDWSCALNLNDSDIDAERGVIVNEWRQRRSAANRMLEKAAPRLYNGDIYGSRMPIGLMSVVENFAPDTLRAFYDCWYIPANQAIIVVGDIDIDRVENSLKKLFSPIPAKRSARSEKVTPHRVPLAPALTTVVESDPEQGVEMMQLYYRFPDGADDGSARREAIAEMASTMLADRFDGLEASVDCPHTSLGIGEVKFLLSRAEKALTLRGTLKPGKNVEALEAWHGELMRAIAHGFNDDELADARKALGATLDERGRKQSHADNTVLAKKVVRHFLDGGTRENPEERIEAIRRESASVTSNEIVDYLRGAVRADGSGDIILLYRPASEVSDSAVEQALADAFRTTSAKDFAPYVAPDATGDILAAEPVAGSIVARDSLPRFDAAVYTLSNGIKVIAKKTDYKTDQIYVRGFSPGGLSLNYDPVDAPTLRVINELMATMAYGGHSQADLRRLLSSSNAKVCQSVGNMEESIEASTNRADMTDAFRLLYLRATAFEPDSAAFSTFVESQRNSASAHRLNPVYNMGDSIHTYVYARHPLGLHNTLEDIDRIDMQKALDVYADRYGDMGDFTFMVIGDFDRDSLENCLTRYLAALPSKGRKEQPADIGYRYNKGQFKLSFEREMENPQSVVYTFYSSPATMDMTSRLAANAFGQILRTRLLADLREDRGWTYSVKSHASVSSGINAGDGPMMLMPVYIKVAPGHEDETAAIVAETVEKMSEDGNITPAELSAVKEYMLKNYEEGLRDNAYWLQVIKVYERDGLDAHSSYKEAVENLTPADVAKWARTTLIPADKAVLIMVAKEKSQVD